MFVIIILLEMCLVFTALADCFIDPLKIQPTPLVLNKNYQIIYPSPEYKVNKNEQIVIACPGNQLLVGNKHLGSYIRVTCLDNESFEFNGEELNFYSVRCHDIPKNIARYTRKNNYCPEGGQEIEIGFDIADVGFIRQIKICFDNINLTPIFSYYYLTSTVAYRNSHAPRKFFEEDGFYSTAVNLDTLYRRDNERSTFGQLLELNNGSEKYIKQIGELFINRGHLAAKGDFVYAFQQLATFHYVNSAPQWATFNGGNWNELEISVRGYAHKTGSDLEIYTGIYGISRLTNARSGKKTELFLHITNGRYLLPIPKLFWKLIYDRRHDKAIVIIGVNNAYEFDQTTDVICNDVSQKITWLNRKLKAQQHNIQSGYIYACTVEEFCGSVNIIICPNITGRNLLL